MPWLPFFADEEDARLVLHWLKEQKDISFVVPDGPKRWKTAPTVSHLPDGRHDLWLNSNGPLRLQDADYNIVTLEDPAAGWTGQETVSDVTGLMSYPGFIVGDPVLFELELNARHQPYSEAEVAQFAERGKLLAAMLAKRYSDIFETGKAVAFAGSVAPDDWSPNSLLMQGKDFLSLSSFGWIGNRYDTAPPATRQWWENLISWVSTQAIALDTFDEEEDDESGMWSMWAFPSALRKLKQGMEYHANNFPLDEKIRAAKLPDER